MSYTNLIIRSSSPIQPRQVYYWSIINYFSYFLIIPSGFVDDLKNLASHIGCSKKDNTKTSGFRHGWLGLRPGWLGFRPGWMAQRGGMDRQMYRRKISLFYRTSSPIGATALPPPHEHQGESRAGQGNRWPSDAFGLLIYLSILLQYLLQFFCLSVRSPPLGHPARPEAQPAMPGHSHKDE